MCVAPRPHFVGRSGFAGAAPFVPSNDVWSQRVRTCRPRTQLFGLPGIPASKPFALAFLICLRMFSRVRYTPFDEQSKTMKESSCLMPMVQQLTVFQLYYELNLYLQRVRFSRYRTGQASFGFLYSFGSIIPFVRLACIRCQW